MDKWRKHCVRGIVKCRYKAKPLILNELWTLIRRIIQ